MQARPIQLAEMVAKALLFKAIMSAIAPGAGLGASGGGGLLAGIFGMRANGGDVSSQRSYIVGEGGPEIFSPSTSCTVMLNSSLNSMGNSMGTGNHFTFGGEFVLRGQDAVLQLARANYALGVKS